MFCIQLRRHHRAASSGRHVAPPWSCRTACLNSQEVGTWQKQIQRHGGVRLSSEREDDQDDVSSPDQANDRMPGRLDNVGHRVLEPRGRAELCI